MFNQRQVWLTEFAVGGGKSRERNDKFIKEILPLLDAAESVHRCPSQYYPYNSVEI